MSNVGAESASRNHSTAMARAARPIVAWAKRSSRRRSSTSASAPARRATKRSGSVVDADMAATHRGDPVNSSMSHDAATAWRNEPMLEKTEATHSARKRGTRSGSTADALTGAS